MKAMHVTESQKEHVAKYLALIAMGYDNIITYSRKEYYLFGKINYYIEYKK